MPHGSPPAPQRVLVVNAGSSSLKLAVLDETDAVVAGETIERWAGEGDLAPLQRFLDDAGTIDAVGHRVVHGGPDLTAPTLLDEAVTSAVAALSSLAPLHNPPAVAAIRTVGRLLPAAPAVACFDTAFHATLSAAARTYALPAAWNERWGLRRYGFHGLSHAYASRRGAELAGADPRDVRMVTCHLGAGASLAAVRDGRSVDTTMGFTPLEGLAMVTRSGTVDPGMLLWLLQEGGLQVEELAHGLVRDSGLAGLSGTSGDLRDVLARRREGDAAATLAFDVFTHRLVRLGGAMAASAGGLDVLVLTGGIGEHAPPVRAALAEGLAYLGADVDAGHNAAATGDADISSPGARVRTVVVTAREDVQIAREVRRVVAS